jgi:hypothetical protein
MDTLSKIIAIATLSTSAGVASAWAAVLADAANPQDQIIGTTEVLVKLNKAGETSLNFQTSATNEHVILTFNAHCFAPPVSYVSVRITVDGVDARPAVGSEFVFCNYTESDPSGTSAIRQAISKVTNAGTHTANVYAVTIRSFGSDEGHIDNSSFVIFD